MEAYRRIKQTVGGKNGFTAAQPAWVTARSFPRTRKVPEDFNPSAGTGDIQESVIVCNKSVKLNRSEKLNPCFQIDLLDKIFLALYIFALFRLFLILAAVHDLPEKFFILGSQGEIDQRLFLHTVRLAAY